MTAYITPYRSIHRMWDRDLLVVENLSPTNKWVTVYYIANPTSPLSVTGQHYAIAVSHHTATDAYIDDRTFSRRVPDYADHHVKHRHPWARQIAQRVSNLTLAEVVNAHADAAVKNSTSVYESPITNTEKTAIVRRNRAYAMFDATGSPPWPFAVTLPMENKQRNVTELVCLTVVSHTNRAKEALDGERLITIKTHHQVRALTDAHLFGGATPKEPSTPTQHRRSWVRVTEKP